MATPECQCNPKLDVRGAQHDPKCPVWVPEWRRRSVARDKTGAIYR